jgi:hypothetical protein
LHIYTDKQDQKFVLTGNWEENPWSHPDAGHVDVGEVELERDTARPDPAGEEHARPELVGERRRDAAEEVPRRAGDARGDDEGAEEAAVLGRVDADACEGEGVVAQARGGGADDLLGQGGGLEAPPHRFRVHLYGGGGGDPAGRRRGRAPGSDKGTRVGLVTPLANRHATSPNDGEACFCGGCSIYPFREFYRRFTAPEGVTCWVHISD